MPVSFNIKKRISHVVGANPNGKPITKEEWLARKEGNVGHVVGGDRPPSRFSTRTGKIKGGKKE